MRLLLLTLSSALLALAWAQQIDIQCVSDDLKRAGIQSVY